MRSIGWTLTALVGLGVGLGCDRQAPRTSVAQPGGAIQKQSLADARKGVSSQARPANRPKEAAPKPPAEVFELVRYDSPVGKLAAYLTPRSADGKKRPALIWITGGDCNSIGECWADEPANNDQSAAAYRKAGIVMMFPSLRGGNDNPGVREGFLGEVDDVLAAADFLANQPHVDPARIYLGGHSTGGSLALLVAECSDRFRAVFSFGPVDDIAGYGPEYLSFDFNDERAVELRSPGLWLHSVRSKTFVFEGEKEGNVDSLRTMARGSSNPQIRFYPVARANHFSILAPVNKLLAQKILADDKPESNLTVTLEEVNGLFGR